jgi:signal transduction histidine kinase
MLVGLELLSIAKKIILTGLLLILIAFFDFISGNEISFSIFYLIPISFAGWYISRNAGIFISVLSAVLWLFNDLFDEYVYSYYLIPYWNALVRLGIFIFITYLLRLIKDERERGKEITQFVVHDLRSPLANILTSLELLNEDREEPPTQNQKELIEISISTGNNMMIFINSLLDLGRLETKKLPLKIAKVEVLNIINSALKQVNLLAREKNIDIKVDCLVDNIDADGNLLLRIIVNLLSNAIKVSNKNSEILVKVENLEEKNVIFSVEDHGPGVPKELENKLFTKYSQGKTITAGSGIGLAFCKLAVEAHGGYINIESSEGIGTKIFFVLPKYSIL